MPATLSDVNVTQSHYCLTSGCAEPDTATRRLVLQRDGYACVCCGMPFLGKPYSVQHRKQRSQGGTNSPSNLIMVLGTCTERIRSHRDPRDEESGYSLRTDQDPELVPILLYGRVGVWLAPDGLYRCEPPTEVQSSEGTQPTPATSLTTIAAAASWIRTGARNVRRALSGRRITLPPFAVVNVMMRVLLQRWGDRRPRDLLQLGSFLKRYQSVPGSSYARIRGSLTSRAWHAPSRRVSFAPRHRQRRRSRRPRSRVETDLTISPRWVSVCRRGGG
jgi:hypothetical protein